MRAGGRETTPLHFPTALVPPGSGFVRFARGVAKPELCLGPPCPHPISSLHWAPESLSGGLPGEEDDLGLKELQESGWGERLGAGCVGALGDVRAAQSSGVWMRDCGLGGVNCA